MVVNSAISYRSTVASLTLGFLVVLNIPVEAFSNVSDSGRE